MNDFRSELKRVSGDDFLVERLKINETLNISIQANEYAYCLPRVRLSDLTEYNHFELGFPNFTPPDYILRYAEDPEDPQETVYGYVPCELIQMMVDELRGATC